MILSAGADAAAASIAACAADTLYQKRRSDIVAQDLNGILSGMSVQCVACFIVESRIDGKKEAPEMEDDGGRRCRIKRDLVKPWEWIDKSFAARW